MSIDNTIFFSFVTIAIIVLALVKIDEWQAKHRAEKDEKRDEKHSGA
ncbi:hypothetical protein [Acidithiobacillus caldus]|nr:hypothetical protein [Acidithiobacillus caldus]